MDDLRRLLYQMADDELIIGHRCSEWLGLGPHIEEDIAFASIAQDEIGHAAALYRLLQELGEGDADELAFGRPAAERQNARFVERAHGEGSFLANPDWDWAALLWRHFFYDEFDAVRLTVAAQSSYQPLAQLAKKINREERYHRLHHQTWLKRLAETESGKQRLAAALPGVWAEVGGLFSPGPVAPSELFPVTATSMWSVWASSVAPQLQAWDLYDLVAAPGPGSQAAGPAVGSAIATGASTGATAIAAGLALLLPAPEQDGRLGHHTADLEGLLATMSEVRNWAPGASW